MSEFKSKSDIKEKQRERQCFQVAVMISKKLKKSCKMKRT